MKLKRFEEIIGFSILGFSAIIVILILGTIIVNIVSHGSRAISWEFISDFPKEGMTKGGIFPAIIGTIFVTITTTLFSIPLGVSAAIYLSEYAKEGTLTRIIRAAIRNLAGVPSIVYGLFGVAIFVQGLDFGSSVLSSGLTLGLLTLPWIIATSEEALKTVPRSYREGSLALGATKWQSIRSNVLPYALPGILTGSILGLSRAAGETAPILFTGVVFFLPSSPDSVFDQFMALPYHLYILSTQHHAIEEVRPLAYGTALVLIVLVLIMNFTAVFIRFKLRKKFQM
ncbi:MAG: phosphate ABC transporter permease PstA [Candidatus Scalinduaceae bacterium]